MPSTARDALTALAALLAPGEPDVAEDVTSAHDDPDAYVRDNADRLDDRGIDEPVPNLAWIALVDALGVRGLLAEVDWKEESEEIIRQLRALRSNPGDEAWAWVADTDIHVDAFTFLDLAGAGLRAGGTTLAVLDIESDCYPLVLVPNAAAADLVSLAAAAGFTAGVLGARRA